MPISPNVNYFMNRPFLKIFLIPYTKLQTAAKSSDRCWDGEGQKNVGAVIIDD